MKQTTVEWLKAELESYGTPSQLIIEWDIFDQLIEQALAMERIQVIYAYDDGANERHNDPVTGEEYYKETYGK